MENLTDSEGIKFVDAMHEWRFDFKKDPGGSMDDVKAFIELHIEQGNTLEMEGRSVGVITGIVGQRRYNIILKGRGQSCRYHTHEIQERCNSGIFRDRLQFFK